MHKIIPDEKLPYDTDGSGLLPSVNGDNCHRVLAFVKNQIKNKIKHRPIRLFDIGSGLGWLVKACHDYSDMLGSGCEGDSSLIKKSVADLILHNLTIHPLLMSADISTTFEVAEHIQEIDQIQFWNNIKEIAPYHFCSIHINGPETEHHKCIRSKEWWINFFGLLGAKSVEVFQEPASYPSNFPFHIETKIAWECSLICLIRWR